MPEQKAEFPLCQWNILQPGQILTGPTSISTYPPSAASGSWKARPRETLALIQPLREDKNLGISKS